MLLTEILFALFTAGLLTAVFSVGFRRSGPWGGVIWFFLLVLLAAWAGGLWLAPLGPPIFGVAWLPFLLVGLVFALLVAAAGPARRTLTPRDAADQADTEVAAAAAAVTISWFFWVLLIGLAAAVVLYYAVGVAVSGCSTSL